MNEWSSQSSSRVRFDWGREGVEAVPAEVVVVVDVLRFTTAVDAAVGADALVYPYRWKDPSVDAFAESVGASIGSLSPRQLAASSPGQRLVVSSLNGATCAAIAAERGATVVAACLRNAHAVGRWLAALDTNVSVIACGERWPDGSLRPALEDLLGAAAVLSHLTDGRSPEAEAAAAQWVAVAPMAARLVRGCASGRELVERSWADDLEFACQIGASDTVPVLTDGAFTAGRTPRR